MLVDSSALLASRLSMSQVRWEMASEVHRRKAMEHQLGPQLQDTRGPVLTFIF